MKEVERANAPTVCSTTPNARRLLKSLEGLQTPLYTFHTGVARAPRLKFLPRQQFLHLQRPGEIAPGLGADKPWNEPQNLRVSQPQASGPCAHTQLYNAVRPPTLFSSLSSTILLGSKCYVLPQPTRILC